MFPRFERKPHRLAVELVVSRRIGRTVRHDRLGPLGSVALPEPISVSERVRFWAGIDQRFLALRARRPGLISPADEAKIRAAIARRIPGPRGAAEVRLLMIAAIQRDVAAIDNLDGAEDVFAEVARRLQALAHEARPKAEADPLR